MSHGDAPISWVHNTVHGDPPSFEKEQGARGQHHVGDTHEDAVIWEVLLSQSVISGQTVLGGHLIQG